MGKLGVIKITIEIAIEIIFEIIDDLSWETIKNYFKKEMKV